MYDDELRQAEDAQTLRVVRWRYARVNVILGEVHEATDRHDVTL